jgi:hypothetical protein
MPTIPLITQSRPLPSLPDPVLDREQRPTVNYRGVMQEMANMVEESRRPLMSPDALSGPYEALASIGRGLADAGSVLGTVAVKKMEAESEVQVANADKIMRHTTAEFQKWQLKNPDHTTWMPELERRLGDAQAKILENPKLHNLAYNQIAPRLTSFADRTKVEVDLMATKKSFADAREVLFGNIQHATNAQDKGAFVAYKEKGLRDGQLTPEDARRLDISFDQVGVQKNAQARADQQRSEKARLQKLLEEDPAKVAQTTTDPVLKEFAERKAFKRSADQINFGHNWIAYSPGMVPGDLDARAAAFRSPEMVKDLKGRLAEIETKVRPQFFRREEAEEDNIKRRIRLDHRIDGIKPEDRNNLKLFEQLNWDITSNLHSRDAELARKRLYFKFGIEAPKGPETPAWDATIADIGGKFYHKRYGVHRSDTYAPNEFSKTVERSISIEKEEEAVALQAKFEANMRRNAEKDAGLRDQYSLERESFKILTPEQQKLILRTFEFKALPEPLDPPVRTITPQQREGSVNMLKSFDDGMQAPPSK